MEEFEGADWVLISDEIPLDEHRRDELLERFQVRHHASDAVEERRGAEDELEEDSDRELEALRTGATPPPLRSGAHFCIFATSVPAAWMHAL